MREEMINWSDETDTVRLAVVLARGKEQIAYVVKKVCSVQTQWTH
jgi:hypothetical protein